MAQLSSVHALLSSQISAVPPSQAPSLQASPEVHALPSLQLRVLGVLIAGAAAFVIAVKTEKGNAAWNLIKEARSEIRRVVWPTNNETTQTTLVVLVMVFIFSLILWGLDSLLSWSVSSLIG